MAAVADDDEEGAEATAAGKGEEVHEALAGRLAGETMEVERGLDRTAAVPRVASSRGGELALPAGDARAGALHVEERAGRRTGSGGWARRAADAHAVRAVGRQGLHVVERGGEDLVGLVGRQRRGRAPACSRVAHRSAGTALRQLASGAADSSSSTRLRPPSLAR